MQIKKIKKITKHESKLLQMMCVCLLMNAVHLTVLCNDAEKKESTENENRL